MEQKIRRDRNMGSNLRRLRDQYGISQEKLCAELQRRGCDIGRTAYAKYESGELNWIIGDPTNWSEEYQKYFFTPVGDDFEWQWSQHAAMITPEGYVFILDNGNNKSKIESEYVGASDSYTRGVMYKIDTENMTIEQIWEYGKSRGSEFYSPYISDVDYITEDHYIVHSGGIVSVDGEPSNQPAGLSEGKIELTSDTVELLNDKAIFEIKLPTNNYRVEKMSLYNENETVTLGGQTRVGSLGETSKDKTTLGFNIASHDFSEVEESHNISITKESDRLVFKGQFLRGTDVEVLLYKNGLMHTYEVPISKKPYTALCVDIFTEEETENGIVVTKYINQEGKEDLYYMGCYGIGVSRTLAALYEQCLIKDEKWGPCGFSLPFRIAPFKLQIIPKLEDKTKMEMAEEIMKRLEMVGYGVIIDDRENISIGAKIKDAKILGTPYVLVLGDKQQGDTIEIENVKTGEKEQTTADKIFEFFLNKSFSSE